jgi:hypothetical protein
MFRKLKLPVQEQEQGCFNKIQTSNNLTNQFWKPALPTKRITHKLKTGSEQLQKNKPSRKIKSI